MIATQSLPFHMADQRQLVPSGTTYQYNLTSDPNARLVPRYVPHVRTLSYAQHEQLRQRKTPQGRFLEEKEDDDEDNPSIDTSWRPPASKHVLLSRPQDNYRPHRTDREPAPYPRLSTTCDPYRRYAETSAPAWNFPGGLDSVLHQNTPIQGSRFQLYQNGQIPTVLPTTFHAHLGPTASAGQQLYGPYWPDGTFSPYRPASIRDDRYFGRTLAPPNAQSYQHHGTNQSLPCSTHFQDLPPVNPMPIRNVPQHHDLRSGAQQLAGHDIRDYQLPRPLMTDLKVSQPFSPRVNASPLFHASPLPPSSVSSAVGPSMSDKIAFRDRTFTWAHQVYVAMLSKLQHENRASKTSGTAGARGRTPSKPAIFPKPPQRTGSHFKEKTFFPGSRPRGLTDKHSPAIVAPSKRGQTNRPSRDDEFGQRGPDATALSYNGTFGSFSPPMDAFSALNTMELLCHEADKPWTDGMLLAGCLAYALEDYAKALLWYQRVLAQDMEHVEAMSNLAATLLALNRKDEALQYWSAAVKLRPSYFEAAEHLIGLLCANQRPRDAVDVISHVERSLKIKSSAFEESDTLSRSSSAATVASNDGGCFDFEIDRRPSVDSDNLDPQVNGFGSSGYAIPGSDNGRLLALVHAKGNMLYALGDNSAAALCFEDAILIATCSRAKGIQGLIHEILRSCISHVDGSYHSLLAGNCHEPILLSPERAQQTAQRMFPPHGNLPGFEAIPAGMAMKAAISTTSNSLLSLAKIYQDGMNNTSHRSMRSTHGTREILALYYLSLSLQRSPSTANNVGILLASVQSTSNVQVVPQCLNNEIINYTGIVPGSGVDLALQYYNYGLNIDPGHAHLYTNLGSLLKDLGQLNSAIKMYSKAVEFDPKFDIALANLANAVKDQGRIADAIEYYRRAVQANPDFAEAVCGLSTALNSVCSWQGRGGVYADNGARDRIHVDDYGRMYTATYGSGLMSRVVGIVEKQLKSGETWGTGVLNTDLIDHICRQISLVKAYQSSDDRLRFVNQLQRSMIGWSGKKWEGARLVRLLERTIRCIGWQWYQDLYKHGKKYPAHHYERPLLPASLPAPTAPTVLPFHTFTTPLSAKQVRQISQRNALRISVSTMRSSWLPSTVYAPPAPPSPCLRVGYVSSDFNNHPLAHLMQSVFGLHNPSSVRAYCYATTASDGSVHRQQIEQEAPVFHNASSWTVEKLVDQIVEDGIHILVNLNGYTRGARNEVFAARPAPIHMSFMGFAGTLGAEWCDYVFADSISVSPKTLSTSRSNVSVEDLLQPGANIEDEEDWMYAENVIFAKSSFFCVDHKQSTPDAKRGAPQVHDPTSREKVWQTELETRWRLRKEIFRNLPDTAVILGNFNQLYKIDPTTFRMYLRILAAIPNAVLWLLRFPDVGEQNLMSFARSWAGPEVASRLIFTDVAPKDQHITRASIVDLFLDTPECNAHTTAADVIWSGTPIVTWARWEYKMCSRMASSIVASAFPENAEGDRARAELLVSSEEEYEAHAIRLASGLHYESGTSSGNGKGRLVDLRRILWEGRWSSRLFDTKRWVQDLETAYWKAWHKWESGEGGDIWL